MASSASPASDVKYPDVANGLKTPTEPPSAAAIESSCRPLLEDVLRGIRPQSGVAYWPEFRAPWGVGFKRDWAVFHIVAQGTCWLQLKAWKEPVPSKAHHRLSRDSSTGGGGS